jgi:hypothetical protein
MRIMQAYLLGKVFSIKAAEYQSEGDEYSEGYSSSSEDEENGDDKILGKVMTMYETRHTILTEASQKPEG